MFKWLNNLKNINLSPAQSNKQAQPDIELAVAVLLVEIMHADHVFDDREEKMVMTILQKDYALTEEQARQKYTEARNILNDAVSLHEYTSALHNELAYDKKFDLLVNLWKLAIADGELDKYEEHLIRKLSELLYVSHGDFIKSKHIAIEFMK